MPKPSFIDVLLEHLRHAPPQAGVITHVEVFHDDWCGIFEGRECDCTPDIASGPAIQKKYEGEAGA